MQYYKIGGSEQEGWVVDRDAVRRLNVNRVHSFPMLNMETINAPRVFWERAGVVPAWKREVGELRREGVEVIASISSSFFSPELYRECGLDPDLFYTRGADGKATTRIRTACYNNPHWIEDLKGKARFFAELGFSGLWMDICPTEYTAYPEIFYCHCRHCQESWSRHLAEKGLDPSLPLPAPGTPPNASRVDQEHMRWFWGCWADLIAGVREATRRDYPGFKYGHNLGVSQSANALAVTAYLMHRECYDFMDFEDHNRGKGGRFPYYPMVSSYLIGRALGRGEKPVTLIHLSYVPVPPHRTAMQRRIYLAEGYASGGTPSNWEGPAEITDKNWTLGKEFVPVNGAFNAFIREHEDLFTGWDSMPGTVGIVFSYWAQEFITTSRRNPAYQAGYLLGKMHIPFEFLMAERDLTEANLVRYRTLFLPDVQCLTDGQLTLLRGFVERGGSVIVSGGVGDFDPELNRRGSPGIDLVAGRPVPEGGRYEIGKGRLLYFARPIEDLQWEKDNPANGRPRPPSAPPQEMTDAFRWAGNGTFPLEAKAASTTGILSWLQKDRLVIHLVNYNLWDDPQREKLTPDRGISISMPVPEGRRIRGIELLRPDEEPMPLRGDIREGRLTVGLEELGCYAILSISLD